MVADRRTAVASSLAVVVTPAAAARAVTGSLRSRQQSFPMKPKQFIQALDHPRIATAITAAERSSSGQIRVFVSHRAVDDALSAARERFAKLGMEKTAARNAVLVFFAPEAQKYAVVGDQGIHARCGGDGFWQELVGSTMRPLLKAGRYTDAVTTAVEAVGRTLAEHFPPGPGAPINELPDAVEED